MSVPVFTQLSPLTFPDYNTLFSPLGCFYSLFTAIIGSDPMALGSPSWDLQSNSDICFHNFTQYPLQASVQGLFATQLASAGFFNSCILHGSKLRTMQLSTSSACSGWSLAISRNYTCIALFCCCCQIRQFLRPFIFFTWKRS